MFNFRAGSISRNALAGVILLGSGSGFAGADHKVNLLPESRLSLAPELTPVAKSLPELQVAAQLALDVSSSSSTSASREKASCLTCYVAPLVVGPSGKKSQRLMDRLDFATAVLIATEVGTVALMTQMPSSVTGWYGRAPKFKNITRSFTEGPRWDQDHWYWNYLGHPISGAEYHLIARNRGAPWWAAFLYSAANSTFWEFGLEAVYERASKQDLIITPFVGSAIGEARYQAKKALIDPKTGRAKSKFKKVLVVMLDPIDAMTRPWQIK